MKTYELPPPSDEQQLALNSVAEGRNVILTSVAGSGKTTFALHCVQRMAPKTALLLTYNAQLKVETRRKVRSLELESLAEVHSFHSFGVRYFNDKCSTDEGLHELRADDKPKQRIAFDIIMIDETQDARPLFFKLLRLILASNAKADPQMIVVGDPRQSIYGFQGADARYLTLADRIFATSREWCRHTLSTTWRLTAGMAAFVNDCLLGMEPVLRSVKDGARPQYHVCNVYKKPVHVLCQLLARKDDPEKRYRPDQIMVLAPSIRSNRSPVRVLENWIVRNMPSVKVFVPVSDEETVEERVMQGKLVFCSYHQSKGDERDVVLLFGMDDGTYVDSPDDGQTIACPNPTYVAVTRARKELHIFQDEKRRSAPFLNASLLSSYADVHRPDDSESDGSCGGPGAEQRKRIDGDGASSAGAGGCASGGTKRKDETKSRSVAWLLRHLRFDDLIAATSLLSFRLVREAAGDDGPILSYDAVVPTGGAYYETVAEITGIAVPALLEADIRKEELEKVEAAAEGGGESTPASTSASACTCTVLREALELSENHGCRTDIRSALVRMKAEYELGGGGAIGIRDMLIASTLYCSAHSGYMFKTTQITKFDWVSEKHAAGAVHFLRSIGIGARTAAVFEVQMERVLLGERATIHGRADVVTSDALYEIKCTSRFQREHLLQLAVYAWMMGRTSPDKSAKRRRLLAYVCSGEMYELTSDDAALDRMVRYLWLCKKRSTEQASTDDEFVDIHCRDTTT